MSKKGVILGLVGVAAVGALAYYAGRSSVKLAIGQSAPERRDIGTLARNFRTTCETLGPLLNRLEAAYADGRLSATEAMSILGGVTALV